MSCAEKWCGEKKEGSECWGRTDVVSDIVFLPESSPEITSGTRGKTWESGCPLGG